MEVIKNILNKNSLVYFKLPGCSDCNKLDIFLKEKGVTCLCFNLSEIDDDNSYEEAVSHLHSLSKTRRCPMLFINGTYYGDYNAVLNLYAVGELSKILKSELNVTIEDQEF
jgi:glutaredoxin|uniref:Glutaredoxin domain-containing protein n=1 Tax=viral metagenome TaxID=1070528 RepID=A0A6C0BP90_9ZZZZ